MPRGPPVVWTVVQTRLKKLPLPRICRSAGHYNMHPRYSLPHAFPSCATRICVLDFQIRSQPSPTDLRWPPDFNFCGPGVESGVGLIWHMHFSETRKRDDDERGCQSRVMLLAAWWTFAPNSVEPYV